MTTDIDLRRLSKTVAHALRHAPWLYELELDEDGWTDVGALLISLRRHRRQWRALAEADLQRMVDAAAKRRYEMESGRIRALYGHSTAAKIRKEPTTPPPLLYHGTAPETAVLILKQGLKPMSRQYVHLSTNTEMALEVGRRKGSQPLVLKVQARAAHQNDIAFYKGNELVWLADYIPPEFITK